MLGNIGYPEMLLLLGIVLLIFGPKNLPKLANSMGRAINDFKKGLSGVERELRDEVEQAESKKVDEKINTAASTSETSSQEHKA